MLAFVLLSLAATPSPAFVAKFKPVTAPFTLNADAPQGAELTADEVISAWPAKPDLAPGIHVFAMGRLGDLLFVRFRHETAGLLNISDEVLVLDAKGAVLGAGQLAFTQKGRNPREETTVVESRTRLTRTSVSVDAVGAFTATLAFARSGTIGSDGTVTFGSLQYGDIQGTFTDPATNERLLFAMDGTKQRAFYEDPKGKRLDVKVEGHFGGLDLVLQLSDGKPRPLTVAGARRSIVWTRPDGTKQRFLRFANPPSTAFLALFPPRTAPVTLDARTPKGPFVPAAVLDGVWPVDQNFGDDERSYAMGRVNHLLFLRTQHGSNVRDEVLVLGKDGRVRAVQHLQYSGDDDGDTTESVAVVGAEGGLTVETKLALQLHRHFQDPLTEGLVARVELSRTGRVTPDGELTWKRQGAHSVDGDYVCAETREYLVLVTVDGTLRALHAPSPQSKLRRLEVTGKATDPTLTLREADGGTQVLALEENRLGLTWSTRKFVRNYGM